MRLEVSKADARRALFAYQFQQTDLAGVFRRLRSVQFDPLSPAAGNHDLVLQARVPKYRTDDWQKAAYRQRAIYDGWDEQASLVAMDGRPRYGLPLGRPLRGSRRRQAPLRGA